jgi:hypothetical protein
LSVLLLIISGDALVLVPEIGGTGLAHYHQSGEWPGSDGTGAKIATSHGMRGGHDCRPVSKSHSTVSLIKLGRSRPKALQFPGRQLNRVQMQGNAARSRLMELRNLLVERCDPNKQVNQLAHGAR